MGKKKKNRKKDAFVGFQCRGTHRGMSNRERRWWWVKKKKKRTCRLPVSGHTSVGCRRRGRRRRRLHVRHACCKKKEKRKKKKRMRRRLHVRHACCKKKRKKKKKHEAAAKCAACLLYGKREGKKLWAGFRQGLGRV